MSEKALAVMPLNEIREMAAVVAKSQLFPSAKSPEAAMALMLLCQAEGLHPMQAMRRYHIIEGQPSMRADAILAEFQARGGSVEWHQHDHEICDATYDAHNGTKPARVKWTMEDAKRASLADKQNWRKYPRQMLRSRNISEGVRMTMPSVVVGIYTPEEVADMGPANDVKPEYTPPKAIAEATAEVTKKIEALRSGGPVGVRDPKAEPGSAPAASAEPTRTGTSVDAVLKVFPGAKEATPSTLDRQQTINSLALLDPPNGLGWKRPHAKNWLKKLWGVESTSALNDEGLTDAEDLLRARMQSEEDYEELLKSLRNVGRVKPEASE